LLANKRFSFANGPNELYRLTGLVQETKGRCMQNNNAIVIYLPEITVQDGARFKNKLMGVMVYF
jgi:hypothetical protein